MDLEESADAFSYLFALQISGVYNTRAVKTGKKNRYFRLQRLAPRLEASGRTCS